MNESLDYRVAEAMCDASRLILWNQVQSWAEKKCPGVVLEYRVGSGKATYLQSYTKSNRYRLN